MSSQFDLDGFTTSILSNRKIKGTLPPALIVKVTGTGTATSCRIGVFGNVDQPAGGFVADFFATGWKIRGVNCAVITEAVPYDITASGVNGTLTTANAGAAWTDGDTVCVCTDEHSAMLDATQTALPVGSEFTITKTLTKTGIGETAAALTGAASGDLSLVRVLIQNDLTNAVSGGGINGVNIITTDTIPLNAEILATGTDMVAGGFIGMDIGFKVAATKAVQVKNTAAGGALTGTGNLTFHLTFRRNTVGSTIAAA